VTWFWTFIDWIYRSFAASAFDLVSEEDGAEFFKVAGLTLADDNTLVIVTKDGIELHAKIVITRKQEKP
jgi:hypothetical protein